MTRRAWTCPTCRRNYAPWVPSCNCINSAVGVNTTSITITPHTGFRMYITCPSCHDPDTHLEIPSPTDRFHTGYWYNKCPNCGAGVEFRLTELLLAEPADDLESMYYITTTIMKKEE